MTPYESSLKFLIERTDILPDRGYNVVSLMLGKPDGESPYPHVIVEGRFKSWEEAVEKAKHLEGGAPVKTYRTVILPSERRTVEKPYRTAIERHFDDIDSFTPERGYTLVGIDCFEDPGEMVFPVGHYSTYEEALAAKKHRCGGGPGNGLLILPDKRAVEPE